MKIIGTLDAVSILIVIMFFFVRINMPPAMRLLAPRKGRLPTKAFVINLPERKDRLQHFKTQPTVLQDRLQVIEATKGKAVDIENTPYLSPQAKEILRNVVETGKRTNHSDLTPNAVGCYLSHVECWRECLKQNHASCVVFEDDARLSKSFDRHLRYMLTMAPSDYDILLMGGFYHDFSFGLFTNRIKRFMCTHAYVITADAISKLLKEGGKGLPIEEQLDFQLSRLSTAGDLKIYAGFHRPALQGTFSSDVQTHGLR